jgi:squalene synthase HpnC
LRTQQAINDRPVSNLEESRKAVKKAACQQGKINRTMSTKKTADAIGHYENFPVASVLCPEQLRAPIAAIYHFARVADDIADEGNASAAERLHALSDYRIQLDIAAHPDHQSHGALDARWAPLFIRLRAAICGHQLRPQLLHDLLDAFVQDVEKTRDKKGYADDDELLDYCRRSANPIGRLLLSLYGVDDAQALRMSDAVCTALQLINFWQDPSVDLPRGRNYFTAQSQRKFGIVWEDLQLGKPTPAISALVQHLAAQARALMLQGAPLVHRVPGRAGWELRLVVQGGLRILEKVEGLGAASLRQRPVLQWPDYAVMLWRAVRM